MAGPGPPATGDSLLPEGVLLLLAPQVHDLAVSVDLHGVVHEAVHVDELDTLLVGVVQHRRDDSQLAHLLLQVLERHGDAWGQTARKTERGAGTQWGKGGVPAGDGGRGDMWRGRVF